MGKFIDLTGQVFGDWKVIRYKGNKLWECECSCSSGRTALVSGYDLRSGKSKSCGHGTNKFVDLTGRVFGYWKVIRYKGSRLWECECTACGNTKDVAYSNLVNGLSKSCGCINLVGDDIIGRQFGYLTVLSKTQDTKYLCRCVCNKKIEVYRSNLLKKSGGTRSCGCKFYENGANTRILSGVTKNREEWQIEVLKDERSLQNYLESLDYKPTIIRLSKILNISESQLRSKIDKYNLRDYIMYNDYTSEYERDILNIVKNNYNGDIITRDRSVLCGRELDIYIPNLKVAIEFNGNYWHSEIFKDKYYHQTKTLQCINHGIHLIHIFEYEWENKEYRYKLERYIESVLMGTILDIETVAINSGYMCNLSKINPSEYIKLGLSAVMITEPSYVWWRRDGLVNKDEALRMFGDREETEMIMRGYSRIYDSGEMMFRGNKCAN